MRWQKIRGIVCSDFPSTRYLKRLYSLKVKSFVSFFFFFPCQRSEVLLGRTGLTGQHPSSSPGGAGKTNFPQSLTGTTLSLLADKPRTPPTFNDTNVYKADKLVAVKTYKNQQFCLVHLLNVLVKALHHFPYHCKRDFIFNDCSPAAIERIVLCSCCLCHRLERVLDLSLQMLSCSHYYNGYTLH